MALLTNGNKFCPEKLRQKNKLVVDLLRKLRNYTFLSSFINDLFFYATMNFTLRLASYVKNKV